MVFSFDPYAGRSRPMKTVRNLRARKVARLDMERGAGRLPSGTIPGTATHHTRLTAAFHEVHPVRRNSVHIVSATTACDLRCGANQVRCARRPVWIPVRRQPD